MYKFVVRRFTIKWHSWTAVVNETAENYNFGSVVKLLLVPLKVPVPQFQEYRSTAAMLSYIEIGATISTLFITDRNDFEFAFEKLRKCRQTGSVILPTPNTVGYQELFLCGAKTAGREAGHVCRSTEVKNACIRTHVRRHGVVLKAQWHSALMLMQWWWWWWWWWWWFMLGTQTYGHYL